MRTTHRPRTHRRARESCTFHWNECQRGLGEPRGLAATHSGGHLSEKTDRDETPWFTLTRTFRNIRTQLLGTPQSLNEPFSRLQLARYLAAKFAAVEECPDTAQETPYKIDDTIRHEENIDPYIDALRIAAAWELTADLLTFLVVVIWPVAAALTFFSTSDSLPTATFIGIFVFVLINFPIAPLNDSTRATVGNFLLLSVAAALSYFGRSQLSITNRPSAINHLFDAMSTGLLILTWGSVAVVSAIPALLLIRLYRDKFVDRLLICCAQQNLVVELVCIAEGLKTQESRIRLAQQSGAIYTLRRLTEARLLIERHAWYSMGDLDTKERRIVARNMRNLSNRIRLLRFKLLLAKDGTVTELHEETMSIATNVHLGRFGAFESSELDGVDTPPLTRLRKSLAHLLFDLPIILVPFSVIWTSDQFGFSSPSYQIPRVILFSAGVAFAIYVALRDLDPSMPRKDTLAEMFLSILKLWVTHSAAKDEDGSDSKSEAKSSDD